MDPGTQFLQLELWEHDLSFTAFKANVHHTKMSNNGTRTLERKRKKRIGGKSQIMQMPIYKDFVPFGYFLDSELLDPTLLIMQLNSVLFINFTWQLNSIVAVCKAVSDFVQLKKAEWVVFPVMNKLIFI